MRNTSVAIRNSKAELGYQKLIGILLVLLILFLVLAIMTHAGSFMGDLLPKIFRLGR